MDGDSLGFDDGVKSLEVSVEEERVQNAWWGRGLTEGG